MIRATDDQLATAGHPSLFDFGPVSATETRVRCQWLVAGEAKEGRDYDVPTLTQLWDVTNRQDWPLCQMVQKGILSRRYTPGPNSAQREPGIEGFRVSYLTMLGEI